MHVNERRLLTSANKLQQTKNWPGVTWTYEPGMTSSCWWFKTVPTLFPFCKDFGFKNKTSEWTMHSPWHNHYPHHTIHSVIQVRGHLPQLLTTVLLLPRSNLLPDAIHWTATSCLNKVSHRCSIKMVKISMPGKTVGDMDVHLW